MALLNVSFYSDALELHSAMDVLLPEKPCPRADGKWPTLYLLHGLSDDHTIWQRMTSIERYVRGLPLAVVMPAVHRSFYADMKHGGRYWQFIHEELPALCERLFPLSGKREDRFAAGLSMGGYGALKLGLLCPERYAAVASLSGAVDMAALGEASIERDASFFTDIFGTLDELRESDNDLASVARRLIDRGEPMPRVYFACGTEDFLYENNQGFLAKFQKPLAITYEEGPGAHTWAFWDAYIPKALRWMGFEPNP